MRFLLSLALSMIFLGPCAQADYAFPIKDPYFATITAGLIKADDLDPQINYEDIKVQPIPERSNVPFHRYSQNSVTMRFWPARTNSSAPLIFIIAGLGGTSSTSYLNFLGNLFQKNGFHVLTLPSPMNWNFALAGSTSGIPGITKFDAKDLYRSMQMGLEKLEEKNISISSKGLMGLSLGALNAAYVHDLDKSENKIGFSRTLLINPPIDVFYALKSIDSLEKEKEKLSADQIKAITKKSLAYGSTVLFTRDIKSADYISDIETALPTSLEERKFLIGFSLHEFLGTLIFTTQQIKDLGILKTPIHGKNPTERISEASKIGFDEYINQFLLPSMKSIYPDYTLDTLKQDSFLFSLEKSLREDDDIFVMHNHDDPIVNSEQLDQLRDIFGSRATIYPLGGHIGNLWFSQNQEDILASFSSLK